MELLRTVRHPNATTSRYLNPIEAADHLGGLNARTVTRWAREGYLPAIPIGEGKRRLWRFLQEDLDAWMLKRRQAGYVAGDINFSSPYTGLSHRCPGQEIP
jgi:excisionase family DNA binding protein